MGVAETFKRSLIAGIALIAPLVVTVVAVVLVLGWLQGVINPIVESTGLADLTANVEIVAQLIALGILTAFVALLGYVANRSVGARAFQLVDRALGLVPVIRIIYGGVRQVSDALMAQQTRFDSVALVEYPREGLYSIAFVTASSPAATQPVLGGEGYNVYIPGSPNPTQGRFLFVPEGELHELDMTVSEGIRLLVTTGIAEDAEEYEAFREAVGNSLEGEEGTVDDVLGTSNDGIDGGPR